MKYLKIKIFLLCLFLVATSCDDGFQEVNVDPTKSSDLSTRFLLTTTLLQTSGERYENWRANLIYSSTMIQHFATLATYWSGDKYLYNAGYSSSLFDRAYPNQVRSVTDIITRSSAKPDEVNVLAVARIWRVVIFHRITDLYGDIPYSEAGKGFIDGIVLPKYDTQESIYKDMLKELEEAIGQFDASKPAVGDADIIYKGDADKWKRFANSMMLRLGLRLIKVAPADAEAWVKKAIAGGVMTGNDDICYIQHAPGPEGINKNGNGEAFSADNNPRLSKTFVDFLKTRNDPRLLIYGAIPGGETDPAKQDMSVHQGLPNGYDANTIKGLLGANFDINKYTEINRGIMTSEGAPMFFQTYAEVEFMLAEAAVRGWNSGTAQDHYNKGIKAAMQYLEIYSDKAAVSDTQVITYLTANPYKAGGSQEEQLEQINTQYWAAVLLNEYEAYANWRRTGYPTLTPVNYPGNESGGTIPRRLRYPTNEASVNPENYQAVLKAQGPDEFTTRIWWDKQ